MKKIERKFEHKFLNFSLILESSVLESPTGVRSFEALLENSFKSFIVFLKIQNFRLIFGSSRDSLGFMILLSRSLSAHNQAQWISWWGNSWSIFFEGFPKEWFMIFSDFSILGKSLLSALCRFIWRLSLGLILFKRKSLLSAWCLSFNRQLVTRGSEPRIFFLPRTFSRLLVLEKGDEFRVE